MATETSNTQRRGRRSALGLVLLVLGTLLAFAGPGPLHSAASAAQPASNNAGVVSIDDFATYPQSGLMPDGCTAGNLITGVLYQLNGGAGVFNLEDFGNVAPGDVVTMSWSGWTEGCETLITLVVKRASAPFFEETTDQALVDFVACEGTEDLNCQVEVPDGQGGTTTRFQLSLTMPTIEFACNYQLDAVVGPPLDVIGPNGSFYSTGLRVGQGKPGGPGMLISANNGGVGSGCLPPTTVVECVDGGAQVTVTNVDFFNTIRVDVLKDGTSVLGPDISDLLELGPKPGPTSSGSVFVPVDDDDTVQLTVVAASQEIASESFINDCFEATTTTVPETTTTTAPATTTTVLATTITQEPSTSTTGATVLGVTATTARPGSSTLPRTGADAGPRLALSLGLVLTGLGLVLFGEDRRLTALLRRI